MKGVSIGINILLTIGLILAGLYLLLVGTFAVSNTTFAGASLYSLILCLFCLAGFSAAIARGLMHGTLPTPPSIGRGTRIMDFAHYRAAVLARFWPFIAGAVGAFFLAFALA